MAFPSRRVVGAVAAGALLVAATACGSNDDAGAGAGADGISGTLRVFAASSLTEAFTTLGEAFEDAHPGVTVEFNFGSSSSLALQINEGAPADVFVSADEANMEKVLDAGEATDATVIARNRLAIVVEESNPKGIRSLADLARPGTVVVLCAPEVPCGAYAAAALDKAGVTVEPASLEENVKAVVTRVTLGEADAGVVYATDVKAATDADGVPLDDAQAPDLQAVSPAATVTRTARPALARAWLEYLASADAQGTLATFGFLPP